MVKAVPLAFAAFSNLLLETLVPKFGISNLPQSPDTGQNSGRGISNFWISGQSLIKEHVMILT